MKPRYLFLSVLLVGSIFLLTACSSTGDLSGTVDPSINPVTVLNQSCASCHDLARAVRGTRDLAGWAVEVDKMIAKGAQLTSAERLALIHFLAQNNGQGVAQNTAVPGGSITGLSEGAALVVTKCTACHNAGLAVSGQRDAAGWAIEVDKMIAKGATMTATERQTLIDFLTQNNGQPIAAVSPTPGGTGTTPSAGGAGADLVASRCTSCHSLARATQGNYDAATWGQIVDNMIARGATLSTDERTTVIHYLASLSASSGTTTGSTDPVFLLNDRCTACHGLGFLNEGSPEGGNWSFIVDQMIQDGAFLLPNERQILIDYLNKNYP